METRVGWPVDVERRDAECPDPALVGFRREERRTLRGVFLDFAGNPLVDAGGDLVTDGDAAWIRPNGPFRCRVPREMVIPRIEPCAAPGTLSGQPVQGHVVRECLFRERRVPEIPTRVVSWPADGDGTFTADGATQTAQPGARGTFCADEDFPDPVAPIVTSGPVPQCVATHGAAHPLGHRDGEWRRIDYPDGWPAGDRHVVWAEDRCFRTETRTRSESRTLGCPAGQRGEVSQSRSVTDSRTAWSPESGRPDGAWQVAGSGDWNTLGSTCRVIVARNDGGGGGGGGGGDSDRGSGVGGCDVDGDGKGDYDNAREARDYVDHFGAPGADVDPVDNCGDCKEHGGSQRPPPRPTNRPQRPDRNYNEGSNDEPGGCFLTTAIAELRGEADDGPTLTALRDFRDGWMASRPDGPALIAEYREVAPHIVAAIPRDHPDWDWIGDQVDRAVADLATARPETAFETYCGMVRRLRGRWLPDARSVSDISPAASPRAARSQLFAGGSTP